MIPKRIIDTSDYCDLRVNKVYSEGISFSNGKMETNSASKATSYSIRVLINGAWGFAITNKEENLEDTFNKAHHLAKVGSKKPKVRFKIEHAIDTRDRRVIKSKISPLDVSTSEKVKTLKELSRIPKSINSRIKQSISYSSGFREKSFYNSFGAEIHQTTPHTSFYNSLNLPSDGEMVSYSNRYVKLGGYEVMNSVEKLVREGVKKIQKRVKLKYPPKGKFDVVCHNNITGLLLHEGLGHACEADMILEKLSMLKNKINKRIIDPRLSIYSDASEKGHGFYYYDDEGVKAKRVCLVKEGFLVNYMHNLETASRMKTEPTSNGRAQNVQMPIVRMSNICLEPGDKDKKELFEDVKNGFFVKGFGGGVVRPNTGEFSFKSNSFYEIKNGRLHKEYRDGVLAGNIKSTLNNIIGVGKNSKFLNGAGGFCGKGGQSVHVDEKVPEIAVRGVHFG